MRGTTTERLRRSLQAIDYPADKDALVDEATRTGADEDTVAALRSIPPVEYGNFNDVLASTPMDSQDEEGKTDAEKARERRHHTHPELSEQQKDVPANPIVEELGENRGS